MKDLRGRAVLVTGASSGIGWETALAFAREGCRLAVAARRVSRLRELSEQVRVRGSESFELACDVRDPDQARRAVDEAARRLGRLDIVINNAGILETSSFESQKLEKIDEIIRTNFLGAAYVLHAALPHMRRRKEGHVVNVASIAGLFGIPYMAAYCASKFALVGFTEAMRRELYGTGIELTAFCPGTVDTAMAAGAMRDPSLSKAIRPRCARDIALRIVKAVRRAEPIVVIGEAPGFVVSLTRFMPRLADWATHQVVRRVHPLAKS